MYLKKNFNIAGLTVAQNDFYYKRYLFCEAHIRVFNK